MDSADEPVLRSAHDPSPPQNPDPPLPERLRRLFEAQPYAVLGTQGGGQPYGSLVAFAPSSDLASLWFATPITTRKFRLLEGCSRVSLVVDDRADHPREMMAVQAVTATGRATAVEGEERTRGEALLESRHPHLAGFLKAPTTAVFRIDVFRYFHVIRFQEVTEWAPDSPA